MEENRDKKSRNGKRHEKEFKIAAAKLPSGGSSKIADRQRKSRPCRTAGFRQRRPTPKFGTLIERQPSANGHLNLPSGQARFRPAACCSRQR